VNVERGLKEERRKQRREDEVFGQHNPRRIGQERKQNSRRHQAGAVRHMQPPGQHRHYGSDQKQQRSALKSEFHAFLFSPPAVSVLRSRILLKYSRRVESTGFSWRVRALART
jgi:hypothetical protein